MSILDPHPLLNNLLYSTQQRAPPSNTSKAASPRTSDSDSDSDSDEPPVNSSFPLAASSESETDEKPKFLDALANLCIHEGRRQETALSLTLTSDERRVILCIAQSTDVSDRVVGFLLDLWQRLGEIAEMDQDNWANSQHPGKTPSVKTNGDTLQKERETRIAILRHCHLKVIWRVLKRAKDFDKFFFSWKEKDHSSEDPAMVDTLINVFVSFRAVFVHITSLVSSAMDEAYFDEFDRVLRELHAFSDPLLNGDAELLASWSEDYGFAKRGEGHLLYKFLKKCVSVYDHADKVLGLAFSSRFSFMLSMDLHIKRIPSTQRNVASKFGCWKEYVGSVFTAGGAAQDKLFFRTADIEAKHALFVDKTLPNGTQQITRSTDEMVVESAITGPVHCECLILAHHHRDLIRQSAVTESGAETNTPPVDYIGCSKPPCYGCDRYFNAYSLVSKDKPYPFHFLTRGSNKRVIRPFVMPVLEDGDSEQYIQKVFFEVLGRDLAEFHFSVGTLNRRKQSP
ncbi:hypothetical protein BD410DRAFT_897556 [Rickenella mellea]|uniref:Uncharacterized protein n=1 Tax=Rickenella mellea TaxID=50990 RepID=A0A4Y7Q9H3_9AGAM|nr:hypothetical protein BD410DRAFT_897556 [Rickenella mellea]